MIGVTVLGSTGSIGVNTLDVIERHSDRYRVIALSANTNVSRMFEQCRTFTPAFAVMADEASAELLQQRLQEIGSSCEVLHGAEALVQIASLEQVDTVMAAIVGAAGLLPTLAAARSGKRILLANKEALVMSGKIFMDEVLANGATLLPVDSEHNAIFQCMPAPYQGDLASNGIRKILLTASGGPFRESSLADLEFVTPDQACAHPNWVMGRKISVDSASMMNKGLELIEACWLFNAEPSQIQVVIHPQSVIHSLVDYVDGSVLAQLGSPDMRTPIANALAWPERIEAGVEQLDLFSVAQLNFEAPDMDRFPCLRLAYESFAMGGAATAVLNAANEVAVEAFLNHQLKFTAIPDVIERTLSDVGPMSNQTLDDILAADAAARLSAQQFLGR